MEQYGDMMASAGIFVYLVVALFLALFAWGIYKIFERSKAKAVTELPSETYEELSEQVEEPKPENAGDVKIGAGNYPCICFRKIKGVNVADFTKINKPVGELYQFDTSCPSGGNGYIVKQDDDKVVDYDPRQEEYDVEKSPEYAWFAINWEICRQVFFVPVQWYKSTSVWFAAAMLAVTFVISLAVIG